MATAEVLSSNVGVSELLDAGLHFGHQTKRWNPKMEPFIFGKRNGIHIIDLAQSLAQLKLAQKYVYDLVASGHKILFVGTKKQAQEVTREVAQNTKQPYVVSRWLGGTLTNSVTLRQRIKRMRMLEDMEKTGKFNSMPKKEVAKLRHELVKLQKNLSGIADMEKLPRALFVVDVNREAIAVKEANRLHVPVIAIVDTNCDPDPIDYPIPGNDDAIRAIRVIMNTLAATILSAQEEYSRVAVEEAQKRAAEQAAAVAAGVAADTGKPAEEQGGARRGGRRPRSEGAGGGRPGGARKRTSDRTRSSEAPARSAKSAEGATEEPKKD